MASIKDNTLTNVKEGSIVNFKAVAQTPLKSLRVNFTPIQQGEGDPSPENIRAINGWTEVDIFNTGKNLFDKAKYAQLSNYVDDANSYRYTLPLLLLPNTTYTISPTSESQLDTNNYYVLYINPSENDPNYLVITNPAVRYPVTAGKPKKITFTTGNTGAIRFGTYTSALNNFMSIDWQLELGSTATEYEPYNGTTIPVSWSDLGTVYGGYVDVTNGKVQKTLHNIDLGTLDWTVYETGSNVYWANIPLPTINGNNGTPIQLYCSALLAETLEKTIGYITGSMPINNIAIRASVPGRIYIKSDAGSASAVKESLNGVIAVYELATHIEYDIDPITIKTLIGVNNIYSNTDSVSVEYYNLESLNLYKQRFKANQPYLQTASGSVASFQTALKAPLKECKVYFQPIQEGEGDASPENVRPISGWTGVDIYAAGKNLLISTDSSVTNVKKQYFPQGINTVISANNDDGRNPQFVVYDSHDKQLKYWTMIDYDSELQRKYRVMATIETQKWRINNRAYNAQLEIGSAPTEFDNRPCTEIPVTFPTSVGTVYGGYIDAVRGKIIAEWECITLAPYEEGTDDPISSSYVQINFPTKLAKNRYDQICSHFKNIDSSWSNGVRIHPNSENRIVISTILFDQAGIQKTTNALFAYFQEQIDNNTPVQIGALLATPIEYDIDPITINTLKGINNIWSNANGDIQTKYWTYGNV